MIKTAIRQLTFSYFRVIDESSVLKRFPTGTTASYLSILFQNKQAVLRVTLQWWCSALMASEIGNTPMIYYRGVTLIERIQRIH